MTCSATQARRWHGPRWLLKKGCKDLIASTVGALRGNLQLRGSAEDTDPLHTRNVSAVLDVLVGLDGVSAAQVVYDKHFLAQAS